MHLLGEGRSNMSEPHPTGLLKLSKKPQRLQNITENQWRKASILSGLNIKTSNSSNLVDYEN